MAGTCCLHHDCTAESVLELILTIVIENLIVEGAACIYRRCLLSMSYSSSRDIEISNLQTSCAHLLYIKAELLGGAG